MATRFVEDCAAFRIATLFEPRPSRDARREHQRAGLSPEMVKTLRVGEDGSLTLADGTPAIRLFLATGRGDAEEVRLTTTRCHYGGVRVWMTRACGNRCAVLYRQAGRWRCFKCAGLGYESQVWRSRAERRLAVAVGWVRRPKKETIPDVVAELRRLSREPERRFETNPVVRIVVGKPELREVIAAPLRDRVTEDENEPYVKPVTDSDDGDSWLERLEPAMRERMLRLEVQTCLLNAAHDAVSDGDLATRLQLLPRAVTVLDALALLDEQAP